MSKKEIISDVKIPTSTSVNLKSIILLLEHLSNKEAFLDFISEYYPDWNEEDIISSYIWFIGSIIEDICDLIIALDPFFCYDFDKVIDRGSLRPLNYSNLCTNTIKGRFVHFIFEFVSKKIFKAGNFDELFLSLKEFNEIIEPFRDFFINLEIPYSKKDLYFKIENLINPVDAPVIVCKDISFIQSRFFKNPYQYLNFFKNEKGDWISAKGFFVGISFSLYMILGNSIFSDNKSLIIQEEIPFENFSQEENGLYNLYSLYRPKGDFETHEFIQLYTSDKGIQPLYKLIDKRVYEYFKKIFKLFNFLPEEENIDRDDTLNVNGKDFKKLDEFLITFPEIKESIDIAKLCYFQNIYTPVIDNTIREHFFFRSISIGLLELKKSIKKKLEILVLHTIEKKEEKKFLGKELIKPLDEESPFYFLNNIPQPKSENNKTLSFNDCEKMIEYFAARSGKNKINIGYFFLTPAFGSTDYSYWIGNFYFGANNLVKYSNPEIESFIEFCKFCKENAQFLDIRAYVINSNYLNYLYELIVGEKVLTFDFPSPFALFFSSSKDIENKIILDNYKESYNRFVKSFESEESTNKEKKEALEYLAYYIFDLLPEFKVLGMDVVTEAEEIDLVITINSPLFDIFEILGPIFIIECRNLKQKVDAKQIRDFGVKILNKNLKGGIIISREGITGQTKLEGARLEIRNFSIRGITILVMDKKDLSEISKGRNPLDIIKRSYTNLYFKGLK